MRPLIESMNHPNAIASFAIAGCAVGVILLGVWGFCRLVDLYNDMQTRGDRDA